METEKKIIEALNLKDGSIDSNFNSGFSKYKIGARIPIFGHAAHSPFACNSTEFIEVPNTYSSSVSSINGKFRLEVVFATNHDQSIAIRMFDPANPALPPTWSFEFKGGHAPNSWWNFQVTDTFDMSFDPWPRQSTLQMKSVEGSQSILGSVVIVVEELSP